MISINVIKFLAVNAFKYYIYSIYILLDFSPTLYNKI